MADNGLNWELYFVICVFGRQYLGLKYTVTLLLVFMFHGIIKTKCIPLL